MKVWEQKLNKGHREAPAELLHLRGRVNYEAGERQRRRSRRRAALASDSGEPPGTSETSVALFRG